MESIEKWIDKRIKIRKAIPIIIIGLLLIPFIFSSIKLPVKMAGWFVPFEVETIHYFPIDVNTKYSKVVGFDRVQIVYKNEKESITVWATTDIGWNNVSDWDGQVKLLNNSSGYYNVSDEMQMISFRMGEVEYAIDYQGNTILDKEELIKLANSIILTKYA